MPPKGTQESYGQSKRLSSAKSHEFPLVDDFKLSYRNKEDITNLPPGVLIVGSQNILTNTSQRVQIRQGYALDGATSVVLAGILASFDWERLGGTEVHMRAGFLTTAANDGKLQYRYVDPTTSAVTWRDLTTALTTVSYNFTTYWNTAELIREVLFVNGTSNIFRWNGATTEIASTTATTITKTGTATWAAAGFYTTANKSLVINGNIYTYTGGETTTTLTGINVTPVGEANGSVVHQSVVTTANSAMTAIDSTFANGLISVLKNQVYVASLVSSVVYISKVNNYIDFSFTAAARIQAEGGKLILDDQIVAFQPQESFMYVSAGKDRWYNVSFSLQTSTVGVTYESVDAQPLKTGRRQGARSQAFTSHIKNDIVVVTNETTVDTIGRIASSFATPQSSNLSDSIKLDIDAYDFTNGSVAYHRYNVYVALPVEGLVLIYDLEMRNWEAPQTIPVSRFYIVDGELYGHGYNTSESYKLFTGYADRVYSGFVGNPIDAKAIFSYQQYGSRSTYKKANSLYVEGYINANTILTCTLTYELDGCAQVKTFEIDGSDTQIVCVPAVGGSLGKESLGKSKLGGSGSSSLTGLPPHFQVEKTFNSTDFFMVSPSFEVLGVDNRFELLAFGLNASPSSSEPVQIRQ